jgi:hypothetical protein
MCCFLTSLQPFFFSFVMHVRILSIFATYTRIARMTIMDEPKLPAEPNLSEEYGTEVLCASWNPLASAVAEPIGQACREWLADLSGSDAESFLSQFYRYEGS